MSYRKVHAAALATLLVLSLAPAARAGARPARAIHGARAGALAPVAAASWLDLLRAFWRGDAYPGNKKPGGGPPPPGQLPVPEGSGLCPHGMMH